LLAGCWAPSSKSWRFHWLVWLGCTPARDPVFGVNHDPPLIAGIWTAREGENNILITNVL